MMSSQNLHPGDMRHSQIPVSWPTPPRIGLDIDRCIIYCGFWFPCFYVIWYDLSFDVTLRDIFSFTGNESMKANF